MLFWGMALCPEVGRYDNKGSEESLSKYNSSKMPAEDCSGRFVCYLVKKTVMIFRISGILGFVHHPEL
jgi:hypothetical protein